MAKKTQTSLSSALTPQEQIRRAIEAAGPKPTRRTNPETLIQREVKGVLEADGWFVVRIHQSLGSTPGIADLVAMAFGRTVWIEVKTPTGKQSQAQKLFQYGVEVAGGEYRIVRSVEDVKDMLERVRL